VDRPPLTAKANYFKKICLILGGGRTTPRAIVWLWGGFGHPRPASLGGRSHPHGQTVALGGGPATPRAISTKYILFYYLFFKILNKKIKTKEEVRL
jgi:hypothetical protein